MLVILEGRSGAGKSTMERLLCERKGFQKVLSCVTRDLRPDEVEGVDYVKMTRDEILDKYNNGTLMEINEIYGNTYGMYPPSTDKSVCVCEKTAIKQIRKFVAEHPIHLPIVEIYLDASKDTVAQRGIDRLERLDEDEKRYNPYRYGECYDFKVNANQPKEKVFKDICHILDIESDFDNYNF